MTTGQQNLLSSNDTSDYFSKCVKYPEGFQFWSGFSIAIFLLGFPASLIVTFELFCKRKQKASNDIFLFSLTVMDIIFTGLMPFSVFNFMIWHNPALEFFFSLIYGLALSIRPLLMACTCVDCYFAVVHPIIYMTVKTNSLIRSAASITIWLISMCFALYMAVTFWAFATPVFSVPFIIALSVITFCDASILQALRKPHPSGKSNVHPQRKRALHTIINSFVMTFIIYLPAVLIFSFGPIFPMTQTEYTCTLAMFGLCFVMTGSVIMPILYLDTLGKIEFIKEWPGHQISLILPEKKKSQES